MMFCPHCDNMLTEMMLMKSKERFMPGRTAPVEYDARCPYCRKELGRMSWGQLTPPAKEESDS